MAKLRLEVVTPERTVLYDRGRVGHGPGGRRLHRFLKHHAPAGRRDSPSASSQFGPEHGEKRRLAITGVCRSGRQQGDGLGRHGRAATTRSTSGGRRRPGSVPSAG